MKSLALCIIALAFSFYFFGCQVAYDSNINSPNAKLEKKPPKGEKSELITFVGDLAGSQVVKGCCPNAGPYPEYSMTLSGQLPAGPYDGQIFMNNVGRGKNKSYMVQFWTNTMFLEVRGGVIQYDKRNKILTATFTDKECVIEDLINGGITTVVVRFTLTRARL